MVHNPIPDPTRGVYGISIAADLVGSVPQNLRLYEARGLLTPARTEGGTRRYSESDLDRLRHIGRLLEAGLNLAGIDMVLELQAANERLRQELGKYPTSSQGATGSTPPVDGREGVDS
ncbi:MAG: MerR family transcriptional regulator [Acidimicrobiales bacterium]